MRTLSILAALIATSLPTLAQDVTLRGQVEDVQGTQNQFFVDCSDVQLTSTLFNLNLFVSQQVEITGTWNGDALNPSVNVTDINAIPEGFGVGGNADLGGEIRFDVNATPGDAARIYAAFGPGFASAGELGTVLLDPATLFRIADGTVPGGGGPEFEFPVPNDAGLSGLTIFAQALVISPSGVATITNNDCKTIDG